MLKELSTQEQEIQNIKLKNTLVTHGVTKKVPSNRNQIIVNQFRDSSVEQDGSLEKIVDLDRELLNFDNNFEIPENKQNHCSKSPLIADQNTIANSKMMLEYEKPVCFKIQYSIIRFL